MHHCFRRSLIVATALAVAMAIGAQLGRWHWLGDLAALVLGYDLALLLVLLALWLRRAAWRVAVIVVLVVVVSGIRIGGTARAADTDRADLRLLVHNIYYLNADPDAIVAEVRRYDPDVVLLMEYSDAIQMRIETQFADYPYRVIRPSRMTMGVALFSRIPITASEIRRNPATRIPVMRVSFDHDGKQWTLVAGHPWPPQPQWAALHRAQMLDVIAAAVDAPHPLIVAGDFNAAPWSYLVRRLEQDAGVRNVRARYDLTNTFRPLPLIGLPLDHVAVSSEWRVARYRYGDAAGSDHLPLILDLALTSATSAQH